MSITQNGASKISICKGCGREYVVGLGDREDWCGCSYISEDAPYWMKVPFKRCPSCGAFGKIDEEHRQGKTSIECSECGHHYA